MEGLRGGGRSDNNTKMTTPSQAKDNGTQAEDNSTFQIVHMEALSIYKAYVLNITIIFLGTQEWPIFHRS